MADPGFDNLLFARYASLTNPKSTLPPNIYFSDTPRTLTVLEQYPKSIFHHIMLPRVGAPPRVQQNLKDLPTFLASPEVSKREAEELLRELAEDAQLLKAEIEAEMIRGYDFKWDIWMGFKIAPSYNDMNTRGLRNPYHFFSFHPDGDEFVHLDDVLSWFEVVDTRYRDNIRDLRRRQKILINRRAMGTDIDLDEHPVYSCYHKEDRECLFEANDLPTMKAHLEEHFNRQWAKARERKPTRDAVQKKLDNRARRLAEEKEREANGQSGTE